VQELAQLLKKNYGEATQVAMHRPINKKHRLHRSKFRTKLHPKSPDNERFGGQNLVFVTASPDYCDADTQFGTFGTRGRLDFLSLIFLSPTKKNLLLLPPNSAITYLFSCYIIKHFGVSKLEVRS
jgi:hypothetical protein